MIVGRGNSRLVTMDVQRAERQMKEIIMQLFEFLTDHDV